MWIRKWQQDKWAALFFTIWGGQAISILGSNLVQFALIWWLTKQTGSATVLAIAAIVGLLPMILITPFSGAIVDRGNRRVIMILADGIVAAATLVLVFLFLTDVIQIWHIYLMMFIRAGAGGFHWSAMQASTSLMVPKKHLSRVQGINQMLNGGMNIISAPLGALMLELFSIQGILVIDVGTAILAITPLLFISIPQLERDSVHKDNNGKTTVWQDFRSGLRYMWSWPGLMMVAVMATLINLVLTPAFSLLPILVTKHFNGQAIQLATMESSWGIGIVLGGLALGAWGGFHRKIMTALVGLIGIGLGTLVIGFVPPTAFLFAVGVMFLTGIFNPITNGPIFAILQDVVAPDMQGRVFSLLISFSSAMSPLGLVIAGPLADKFGVQTWFIIGGILTTLMGIGGLFIPAIMNIEGNNGSDNTKPEPQLGFAVSSFEND